MQASQIPNLISILRILLVPPVVMLLLAGDYGWALILFLVAGISDGIDGYLARHYHWTSRLGAILDPLADKLLMVCTYLTLGWLGDLAGWLVGLVIWRDVVIVAGTLLYRWRVGPVAFEPLMISKINTVCQILLVVATLLLLTGVDWLYWPQRVLVTVVAFTTLASGLAYVFIWSRRAREHMEHRESP